MSVRVLVAFDKFKDALSAERAVAIAARTLRELHPHWTITCAPISDGGDGFCRILTEAAGGEILSVRASGPWLEARESPLGLVPTQRIPAKARALLGGWSTREGRVAIVEMAAINGLALVPPAVRDPWRATSYGTGQLLRAAAEFGAVGILLGIGGSATSDLGLGALSAVGYEFRDADHAKVRPPFPAAWERIAAVEGDLFSSIPPIAIACDVANPLLGANGAAAVYGPQKGLRPDDLPRHEAQAARLAAVLCRHTGRTPETAITHPGSGAAGGIAFGLMTAAGARLVPGFELVTSWLDLDAQIAAADFVVTGEGRFDASSLSGKGPGEIVRRARSAGKRTIVFAGAIADDLAHDRDAHAITPPGVPLSEALQRADKFLAEAVSRVFAGLPGSLAGPEAMAPGM